MSQRELSVCCSCSTLHSPTPFFLVAEVPRCHANQCIAVAQTAPARSRTPCIVASEEAKSEIAVKEVTE